MIKQNSQRITFKAPANVVSEEMQATINEFLNAEYYAVITNTNGKTRIDCQCVELILDGVKHMAMNDKTIKDDLTNIVIDLQRDNGK